MIYGKQDVVYTTLPFCSHLVQNPEALVLVQVEIELMEKVAAIAKATNKENSKKFFMEEEELLKIIQIIISCI